MDLTVDDFIDDLFKPEAQEEPSDKVQPEKLDMELPPWYDEKKFEQARRFYWDNCFAMTNSMLIGLICVFAVPSILKVLVATHKSSSTYTAYKRYLSTILHTVSWFENKLTPGSTSWKSLYAVRSRHIRASLAGKLQGAGIISQRDLALTQFGFVGFAMIKPDMLGIQAFKEGDWEAYNHFWSVIGHMIGLNDRYNICRKTVYETRQVCQILLDRVYTPCLENVPEYFEHMSRSMIEGLWSINPSLDSNAVLFYTKYLANVPGYVFNETERVALEDKILGIIKNKPRDTGVEVTALMKEPILQEVAPKKPRLIHLNDYEVLDNTPEYKRLTMYEKYRLNFAVLALGSLYGTFLGRLYFNINYRWSLLLMKYFPFLAFHRFGFRTSYVDIFVESPTDDTKPKSNCEYYKPKGKPWYWSWLNFFWSDL